MASLSPAAPHGYAERVPVARDRFHHPTVVRNPERPYHRPLRPHGLDPSESRTRCEALFPGYDLILGRDPAKCWMKSVSQIFWLCHPYC
jgi:hypothetical protein